MKNIAKIIFFLFLLQSCSSDGYKIEYDSRFSQKLPNKNEGVVISLVDISFIDSSGGEKFDNEFVEMNWCLYVKKKCKDIVYFNPYTKKKFNDVYTFNTVKAGTYNLDYIKQSSASNKNWFLFPVNLVVNILLKTTSSFVDSKPNFRSNAGYNKKLSSPNFASFEVQEGEMVYIGDLYFKVTKQKYWFKGKINLEIQDNYDEAVKYFHYKHPEFRNKTVVKRLAQPGVLLDNYDAGFFW